ncbi:SAM domain-containing protein, partial [Aureobasidium melanogenum]
MVHVRTRRTGDGNTGRAWTRTATLLEGSELLSLQGSSLLRSQDLTEFVGHKDVHVLLLLLRVLRLTLIGACAAELLDVVKLDAVVDGRESGQLHGSSISNHVGVCGTLLLCVEVGKHWGVDHRGPAVVGVVRRENVHSGVLVGCRDSSVLQVGVTRQLEWARRTQRLAELAHGLLTLRRAGPGEGESGTGASFLSSKRREERSPTRLEVGVLPVCSLKSAFCFAMAAAASGKIGRRQNTRHGVALGHLLQDLDEEANLHLGGLLQQGVEGGSALWLAEHAEPLLNSAELILEILIQRSGSHVLEGCLVLVDVGDPLLSGLFSSIVLAPETNTAEVDLAGGSDAA